MQHHVSKTIAFLSTLAIGCFLHWYWQCRIISYHMLDRTVEQPLLLSSHKLADLVIQIAGRLGY